MEKTDTAQSTPDLVTELVDNGERIVRLHVDMARAEAKEFAMQNGIAAACFAVGAWLALIAVFVGVPVLTVAIWGWRAAVIWIVTYLLAALVLVFLGRDHLRTELPQRTLTSLKETKEWALRLTRSNTR